MEPSYTANNYHNDILLHTTYITVANGRRVPTTSASPLIHQLQQACETGSLSSAEQILSLITPLPPSRHLIPGKTHVALQECLRTAVVRQHYKIVYAMLKRDGGFLPYHLSSSGIDAAFRAHDTRTLQVFICCGWDVNEAGGDMRMRPLLQHAVNKADLRSFLLANGANPNTPNRRGFTSLETAAQHSNVEVVRELLDHGGEPRMDDSLVYAAEAGRIDVAELLVERGADVNALEKELPHPWGQRRRRTVLEVAWARNHQHMVRWLESHGATSLR